MMLLPVLLDGDELGTSSEPHLLGDAARHACLLLGDRHRDTLASLRTTATKDFTTTTGLLTGAEAVRALAALIVGLIRTLHGLTLRALRSGIDTQSGEGCQGDVGSVVRFWCRGLAIRGKNRRRRWFCTTPDLVGKRPVSGVESLSISSCGAKSPSATYGRLSAVDNS
jgi:hypothetical protein